VAFGEADARQGSTLHSIRRNQIPNDECHFALTSRNLLLEVNFDRQTPSNMKSFFGGRNNLRARYHRQNNAISVLGDAAWSTTLRTHSIRLHTTQHSNPPTDASEPRTEAEPSASRVAIGHVHILQRGVKNASPFF